MVAGREIPESTNSLLSRLADETVTSAPLAVRLPLSAELDPTTTLPKLRLVGDTANVPASFPFPESAMPSGEFDAFETTDRLPFATPSLVGVKITVNVTLWLGVRLMGKPLNPLMEKPAPVTFACEMATADPPVLVKVSERLEL